MRSVPLVSVMNIEEAKRALLRRDEDVMWMRLVQAFHRERGEILRLLQRRQEEARKAHEKALRDAQDAFEEARALERRDAEDEATQQRALERDREAARAREAKRQQDERREREAAQQAAKEVEAQHAEERHLREVEKRRTGERKTKHAVSDAFRLRRAEYNRAQTITPQPKGTSHSAEASRGSATTPNFSPRRTIATQQTVEDVINSEKEAQRQQLEVRRLQNLVAQRQMAERERQVAEVERRRLDDIAKRRGEELEREKFEAQRHHVQTILTLERDRDKRLTKRLLVPLQTPPTGPDDRTYRTASPSAVASVEARKSNLQFQSEARQRRETDDADQRRQAKESDKEVSLKTAKNILAQRERIEEQRRRRDAEYLKDLEDAKRVKEQQEMEARNLVECVKEEQRKQADTMAFIRAERQREAAIKALEMKLESVKLADVVEARDREVFKSKMAEADLLTHNRTVARQLMNEKTIRDQQRAEAVAAEDLKRRQRAQAIVAQHRKERVEEHHMRHQLEALDRGQYRERLKARREVVEESNDAFYRREVDTKPRKPRVPIQPEASAPVKLPPHPELAAMERDAAARVALVEDDLAAVDARLRQLSSTRL
jgi:hypothetical protein